MKSKIIQPEVATRQGLDTSQEYTYHYQFEYSAKRDLKSGLYVIELVDRNVDSALLMAEHVGNDIIKNWGLEHIVKFISSGTKVEENIQKKLGYKELIKIFQDIVEFGGSNEHHLLLTPSKLYSDKEYATEIRNRAKSYLDSVLVPQDIARANLVLMGANLPAVTSYFNQTVIDNNMSLVLCASHDAYKDVLRMYGPRPVKHKVQPRIVELKKYVEEDCHMNPLIGTSDIKTYEEYMHTLKRTMPLVIDTFMRSTKLN